MLSSKQKHAVKGKVHKVPQNQGWTALSWDDLTEWAGPRSVERGRAYQKQGRVHDLAISEDGWLLATVTGGERYAVTVWCEQSAKTGGALYSRCTCPVGASGCKHAVAVVAEYLEMLGKDAEAPVADQDDERWEMLADESGDEDDDDETDDLDMDSEVDDNEEVFYVHRHRHPEASGRKTLKASNGKIRKHIEAKSRDELVELVWALTERFTERAAEGDARAAAQLRGWCYADQRNQRRLEATLEANALHLGPATLDEEKADWSEFIEQRLAGQQRTENLAGQIATARIAIPVVLL